MQTPRSLRWSPLLRAAPSQHRRNDLSPTTHRATPMNPSHVHTPVSTRVRCPVCHHAVYSRGGIHPQCAVRQAEPPKPRTKAQVPPGPAEHAGDDSVRAGTEVLAESPAAERAFISGHLAV